MVRARVKVRAIRVRVNPNSPNSPNPNPNSPNPSHSSNHNFSWGVINRKVPNIEIFVKGCVTMETIYFRHLESLSLFIAFPGGLECSYAEIILYLKNRDAAMCYVFY